VDKHEGVFQLVSDPKYGPAFVTFHRKVNYLTGLSPFHSDEDEKEAEDQVGEGLSAMLNINRNPTSSSSSSSSARDIMSREYLSSSHNNQPDDDGNGENREDDGDEDDDFSSKLVNMAGAGLCARDWEVCKSYLLKLLNLDVYYCGVCCNDIMRATSLYASGIN
jgi:hypothetical protein